MKLITALLVLGVWAAARAEPPTTDEISRKLLKVYPESIASIKNGTILFKNGKKVELGGAPRNHLVLSKILVEKDAPPDSFLPVDMFCQNYPAIGTALPSEETPPAAGFDPGRIRSNQFFNAMYGGTEASVGSNIVSIPWITSFMMEGKSGPSKKVTTIRVTRINGVDKRLAEVRDDLLSLPEDQKNALKGVLFDVGGFSGFNYRKVSGQNFLSAHSWGIAIDVNWDTKFYHRDSKQKYANNIPQFVVDIFEKRGFIAGCRWSHFDSMHFEYRPELLDQ